MHFSRELQDVHFERIVVENLAHPVCELDQSIVKMSFMLSYFIKTVISGVMWIYLPIVLLLRIFSPVKNKKSKK